MPTSMTGIHITNILGFIALLLVWIVLCEIAKMLVLLLRNDPLIGWAIGPLGISALFLSEPSIAYIIFKALFPALVSGCILYFGLFTTFPEPIVVPHHPFIEILVVAAGVLLTSTGDFLNALRDIRYPLWGEARILRTLQSMRASWATIHFTAFGLSYLRDHFHSTPTDILQAF
ncbi:MAG TPA: hypothetical protein VKV20_01685 [Ktedonobacteraceae bacterium]|nr:hypothetical protein [Ktedonobacteraceae bacterium]